MRLRISHLVSGSEVEGPGRRAAVWVQGCSIRCPGCFNPHTWSREGGSSVEVAALAEALLAESDIEGVTFLGGEPFDQAEALAAVGRYVRERGLSVMTFTGYRHELLLSDSRPGWADLLAATDLLVDGPFVRALADTGRPWIGSSNQRVIALTDRYRDARWAKPPATSLEVRVRADGTVFVNGMTDRAGIVGLRRLLTSSAVTTGPCPPHSVDGVTGTTS